MPTALAKEHTVCTVTFLQCRNPGWQKGLA
jgi:hypothetical protein